jgi:hypothetical protein
VIYFPFSNYELNPSNFWLLGYFLVKSKAGKTFWLKNKKFSADWVSYLDLFFYCCEKSGYSWDRDYIGEFRMNDEHRYIPDREFIEDEGGIRTKNFRYRRYYGWFTPYREE